MNPYFSFHSIRIIFALFSFVMMMVTAYCEEKAASIDISKIVDSSGANAESSALIIIRLDDGAKWVSGGSRLKSCYPPASTAKIPHTLIALEEGYAEGAETLFPWDGEVRFLEVWNRDHTLKTAFENSVVWVYQQITRDLGYDIMASWIDRLEYGNRHIGEFKDITTYWLDGPLLISAEQQVEFLTRLAKETLPFTLKTFAVGKEVMQEENGENWTLFAKTGFSGSIGWYVGWIASKLNDLKQTYVFAFNLDIQSWDDLPKRKEVVRQVLHSLGILPNQNGKD